MCHVFLNVKAQTLFKTSVCTERSCSLTAELLTDLEIKTQTHRQVWPWNTDLTCSSWLALTLCLDVVKKEEAGSQTKLTRVVTDKERDKGGQWAVYHQDTSLLSHRHKVAFRFQNVVPFDFMWIETQDFCGNLVYTNKSTKSVLTLTAHYLVQYSNVLPWTWLDSLLDTVCTVRHRVYLDWEDNWQILTRSTHCALVSHCFTAVHAHVCVQACVFERACVCVLSMDVHTFVLLTRPCPNFCQN